ncbi:hypothetical protein LCGC14_1322490 [marine sediment metagenome]|uniref:Disease resistance R13L4/SHOC-2-like LRR domain-containing protein n=1 Tax=marine sediment metagenome TaxID=412755 RepID=A0A0F9NLF3_9ZZZZ|nr:MAG: leucine-rich repeat domain protein [Candidatus Lokiarchaeum sp. GC14_75]HEC38620.1 leucine-rich repeat domain-containing protein [bacterium]
MDQFRINEYITLKLEAGKTVIYIRNIKFMICKRLIINISEDEPDSYKFSDSIDEVVEENKHFLYKNQIYEEPEGYLVEESTSQYLIKPEEEFWGHCSNLQAWAENNYDTRLLRNNLAFPLLKKLTDFGAPLAKSILKQEIVKRLASRFQPIIEYLFNEHYVWDYLDNEEILSIILDLSDYDALIDAFPKKYKELTFQIGRSNIHDRIMDPINIAIVKGRIVELTLDSMDLNEFPEAITRLTALEKLWLSFNKIKTLPKTLGNLKKLKVLDIGHNLLTEVPDSITNLTLLEEIWISGNQINNIPEKIKKIRNLCKLN